MSSPPDLDDDGFIVTAPLLSGAQLDAARAAADHLLAAHGAESEYGLIAHDAWRRAPALRELLAPLARIARDLCGLPQVRVFQDLVIDKPRAGATWLPYHQDQSFLPLDRDDGLVAWVALDDVDVARGCLHYVPGTHRLGPRRPTRFSEVPERDVHLPPIELGDRAIVPVPAVAGQALFHRTQIWHASPPNTTDTRRRAWSIYFLHPEVRWAPERAPHPFLLELRPEPGAPVTGDRFPLC